MTRRLHFLPIPKRQRAVEARRIAPKGERIRAENAVIDATNDALREELGGFAQWRRAQWGGVMGEVCKCCGQKMPGKPAPVAKIRDVLHAIERAGVAIEDVLARNMTHEVCVWRKAGYAAARQATGASYPKIGRAFRRDHTTIMVGERGAEPRRVQALLKWTAERVAERAGA